MTETTSTPADPSPTQLAIFSSVRTPHEGTITLSWIEQSQVEEDIFLLRNSLPPERPPLLLREKHISYLLRHLHSLPNGYSVFDSLQTWLAFWSTHSLNLLGATIPSDIANHLVDHLNTFKDINTGGYGGGPRQIGHLACTFSAVMALCSIGTDYALESIDKQNLSRFIQSMKQEDGSYRVSENGETDVRATYCALAVASMIGLLDKEGKEDYTNNSANYIAKLQAFDGGLGGEPGTEAHGGNTYCGVAALAILNRLDVIDTEALLDWAVMRQMGFEGGFQGRVNKLVDSCYSFWVGSLFALLSTKQGMSKEIGNLFDGLAVQKYVLECCQFRNGGLRDKPGAPKDLMHACYALSGVSVAQHFGKVDCDLQNGLRKTNPIYNLCSEKFEKAWYFFRR